MPELTPQDVARSAARRFCGWHVTPVVEEIDVKRNGSGSGLLVLRTLKLVSVTAISENGIDIYPDEVEEDADAPGHLYKRSGAAWRWGRSNIVVSFSHGFADDEAPDFNAAVASIAERSEAGDKPRVVGPVQWDSVAMAAGSAFSVVERSLLEQYRLESPA